MTQAAAGDERAVRGLFTQAARFLPQENVTIANMHTDSAETIMRQLLPPLTDQT